MTRIHRLQLEHALQQPNYRVSTLTVRTIYCLTDLDLFVQRDKTTGEVAPTLQLKLTRTKSRKKRKTEFVQSTLISQAVVRMVWTPVGRLWHRIFRGRRRG